MRLGTAGASSDSKPRYRRPAGEETLKWVWASGEGEGRGEARAGEGQFSAAFCSVTLRGGPRVGHRHGPRVGTAPSASALGTSLSLLLPLANSLQLGDLPPGLGPTLGVVFDAPLSLLSVVISEAAQPLSTAPPDSPKTPLRNDAGGRAAGTNQAPARADTPRPAIQ